MLIVGGDIESHCYWWAFLVTQRIKNLPATQGPESIPQLGRSPGEGNGNPPQHSCLEKPHGQRSLAGCSAWDHKESDTTEGLNYSQGSELERNNTF